MQVMKKNIKEKIINLREKGLSYKQIKNQLDCSLGTIGYHCSDEQRHKTILRKRKSRKNNPLKTKISHFKEKTRQKKTQKHILQNTNLAKPEETTFEESQLLEKIGENPVCYLTGRAIDLNDSKSYNLDHIIPRSKGGDNSLNNCQIACSAANRAKSDLSYEDFIQLCKDVVAHYEKKKYSPNCEQETLTFVERFCLPSKSSFNNDQTFLWYR